MMDSSSIDPTSNIEKRANISGRGRGGRRTGGRGGTTSGTSRGGRGRKSFFHHYRSSSIGTTSTEEEKEEKEEKEEEKENHWRQVEEEFASKMIQRIFRGYLGRQLMIKKLTQLYQKQYDPIQKQYFYLHTKTNESTYEKPKVLRLFMPKNMDLKECKPSLFTSSSSITTLNQQSEAASMIQRMVRVYLAIKQMKLIARESYMKLFDEKTKLFYYLNTRNGQKSEKKPFFLNQNDEDDDLEIETFLFRKSICKIISTDQKFLGNGIIGFFHGILCVLTVSKTIGTIEMARTSHLVCQLDTNSSCVQIVLASEKMFFTILDDHFLFCGINLEQFQLIAGQNIIPLQFDLNDRKMGCLDLTNGKQTILDYPIEIVAFPHGKKQIVYEKKILQAKPNQLVPKTFIYNTPMETGSFGCGIFTRNGKLIGIQQFTKIKEPAPIEFTNIKIILQKANEFILPPSVVIRTSCLSSLQKIDVSWQKERENRPTTKNNFVSTGCLQNVYQVEICQHLNKQVLYHDDFQPIYQGLKENLVLKDLLPDTMYSIRCRCINQIKKSPWCPPLRFVTPPKNNLGWQLKHCKTIQEAVKRMMKQNHSMDGQQVNLHSVKWIWTTQFEELFKKIEQEETKYLQLVSQTTTTTTTNPNHTIIHFTLKEQQLKELFNQESQVNQELKEVDDTDDDLLSIEYRQRCLLKQLLFKEEEFFKSQGQLTLFWPNGLQKWWKQEESTTHKEQEELIVLTLKFLCALMSLQQKTTVFFQQKDDCMEKMSFFCQEMLFQVDKLVNSKFQIDFLANGLSCLSHWIRTSENCKQIFLNLLNGFEFLFTLLNNQHFLQNPMILQEIVYLMALCTHDTQTLTGRTFEDMNDNILELTQKTILQWLSEIIQNNLTNLTSSWSCQILFWSTMTLGNFGFYFGVTNQEEMVNLCGEVKRLFLLNLHEIEIDLTKKQFHLTHLQNYFTGKEEIRNEMDFLQQEIQQLKHFLQLFHAHHLQKTCDFAMKQLMSTRQEQLLQASHQIVLKFLNRKLTCSFNKWQEFTVFQRHCQIFKKFLQTVKQRQLIAGFRQWERQVQFTRQHQNVLTNFLQNHLFIDLNKTKRERYKSLAYQK